MFHFEYVDVMLHTVLDLFRFYLKLKPLFCVCVSSLQAGWREPGCFFPTLSPALPSLHATRCQRSRQSAAAAGDKAALLCRDLINGHTPPAQIPHRTIKDTWAVCVCVCYFLLLKEQRHRAFISVSVCLSRLSVAQLISVRQMLIETSRSFSAEQWKLNKSRFAIRSSTAAKTAHQQLFLKNNVFLFFTLFITL